MPGLNRAEETEVDVRMLLLIPGCAGLRQMFFVGLHGMNPQPDSHQSSFILA